MKPPFTAVAFCTENPPYPEFLSRLVHSLEHFGIQHETRVYPDTGDWCSNTHLKALFLRDIYFQHEGERLLYIDADAVVRKFPDLAATMTEDFGASFRRLRTKDGTFDELLSGTLIFHCNSRVLEVFNKWIELNFFNDRVGDQVNLAKALNQVPVSFLRLPPEYTFIFDITGREYPGLTPTIEHFQASRIARAKL